MDGKDWVSIILALTVPIIIFLGFWNRANSDKGIGWQFIRYNVLMLSLPIIGVLAIRGDLTEGATALIGAAMGYAFGRKEGA